MGKESSQIIGVVIGVVIAVLVFVCLSQGVYNYINFQEPELGYVSSTGTYQNPVPIGDIFISSDSSFGMGIPICNRGNTTNEFIDEATFWNDKPKEGYEYMMIYVLFSYQGDEIFEFAEHHITAYSNGVECERTHIWLPDETPKLESFTNMLKGGSVGGWKVLEVPIEANVIISYDPSYGRPYYFDVGPYGYSCATQDMVFNPSV